MIKKQIFSVFLSALLFIAAGCDSSSQNVQVQDISELEWQSDGSAIYGFIQSYISTANSSSPASGVYDIAKFDAAGSLLKTYTNSFKSRLYDPSTGEIDSYAPALYLSPDASTIVTQLDDDLYRFHAATNTLEKLVTQFHLIVLSPDLHYAVGTNSSAIYPTKTIYVFDITSSPAREVKKIDVSGVAVITGIWLSGGTFGITRNDSVGTNIGIYDTTGVLRMTIPGAGTPFHNVVYNAGTNDLFVQNHAGKISPPDYSVDKINLTTSTRTNILSFAVENFDVTKDEQVIVYSDTISAGTLELKVRNLQSLKEQRMATNNLAYAVISPVADRVAYLSGDVNFKQIQVIPFTRP